MEELDLLKKAWQKDSHSYEQLSESEIYNMLHKKSSSIVKWILIISIIEVLFWTLISVCFNTDEYLKKIHAESLSTCFQIVNFVNYAVILCFIYVFYKNYIKISTTVSTRQLMQDILRTRKTVKYYVWYNLAMILLCLVTGFTMAFNYDPVLKNRISHESNFQTFCLIGTLLLISVVIIFAFWLIYLLLYGILLRKLNRNYKELKKIDL